jgi:hypothetical protein
MLGGDIGGLVCEGILNLKYRKLSLQDLTSVPHPFPVAAISRPLPQTLSELQRNLSLPEDFDQIPQE